MKERTNAKRSIHNKPADEESSVHSGAHLGLPFVPLPVVPQKAHDLGLRISVIGQEQRYLMFIICAEPVFILGALEVRFPKREKQMDVILHR